MSASVIQEPNAKLRRRVPIVEPVAEPRRRVRIPKVEPVAEPIIEPVEPGVEIRELARRAVEETANSEDAVAALSRLVEGNPVLEDELRRQALVHAVAGARTDLRRGIENDYLEARERGLERHVAALRGRARLFDWKLPETGVPLGDATVDHLYAAVQYHEGRMKGEMKRAQMYRMIAERLEKSRCKTVRRAFKEDELATLIKEFPPV